MFDIETINKLLMDELSAMETYQETLDKRKRSKNRIYPLFPDC